MRKTVTILGRKFQVKLVEPAVIEKLMGYACDGCCAYTERIIYINKRQTNRDQTLTLFHEVGHIIEITTGLAQVTEGKLREIWCESMANGYYDLIHGGK